MHPLTFHQQELQLPQEVIVLHQPVHLVHLVEAEEEVQVAAEDHRVAEDVN
jgi:hypothetical protein